MRTIPWPGLFMTTSLILCMSSISAAQDFKVVAHPSVKVDSISRAELSRIFLKKQAKWPDGTAAVPVDLPITSEVRDSFSKAIHQKGTSAIDAYWQKQIFSGRDVPPVTKANDSDVIAYVRANAGAVGYVSASAATTGVKAIDVR
jgi:ABC-type phosphate transport system substrate-binding protein